MQLLCQQLSADSAFSCLVRRLIHGGLGRLHQPAQLAVPVCKNLTTTTVPTPSKIRKLVADNQRPQHDRRNGTIQYAVVATVRVRLPVSHRLVAMVTLFNPASPSRHLCLVVDWCKHRTTPDAPSIGTVSPAPLAGLVTFRPLLSFSLHFRRLHFRSIAFRRPQTAETGKDSGAMGRAWQNYHRHYA
jgi:hypothetical protein